MKYLPIILIISIFAVLGCLESSPYKTASPSELLSNAGAFEGKSVCINGVFEDNSISGILIEKSENFTRDYKNGTLVNACGTFRSARLESDYINQILSISTEKEIYHSNETLEIQLDFNSSDSGKGQIEISGIKNAFGRPSINEKREAIIEKGSNRFVFEFKTPSCEDCSAIEPGVHDINATVKISGKTFEAYKKITLEREGSNASNTTGKNSRKNDAQIDNLPADTALQDNKTVTVEYFYIPGCQKCEKATPVVENVIKSYGDRVKFIEYNANEEGRELAINYQIPGTPSVVINKDRERIISYESYEGDTARLEAVLKEAIDKANISISASNASVDNKIVLSVPSVFVVGFLAGFNPCLLAILAFIASVTLATTGRRRNVLLIVLMFSLGIFVTYLIVGIGLLRIIEQSPSLQGTIRIALVMLIGVLGIWHVYDAYHLRKNTESSFYTPKAFIRLTESVTKQVSLPASFFMGALFSLIKAPCVGAVYFVILDMVRSGDSAGILYLAAYNLGVVFPVLILGAAIAFGLNPEHVEKFRKERRSEMRLLTGATLILIAVLMYAGVI
ncbi:MAG TPA: cytochrome c biogenesis protein CcdA [Candidatus Methanoperedens sp.]